MTFEAIVQTLPEWILLIGGCVALIMGASARSRFAPFVTPVATACLVLALVATVAVGRQDGVHALPGLLLGPLTYYVRLIGLGIGVLLTMVNWYQPDVEERGEYMSMILFSLLGLLLVPSANDLVVLFFAIELVSIPTYVLVALSRRDQRASEAAVKYFFLGAMSAALLAFSRSQPFRSTHTRRTCMKGPPHR